MAHNGAAARLYPNGRCRRELTFKRRPENAFNWSGEAGGFQPNRGGKRPLRAAVGAFGRRGGGQSFLLFNCGSDDLSDHADQLWINLRDV